jgi:hypothetical protein
MTTERGGIRAQQREWESRMGTMSDMQTAEWQEAAGIKPATGERASLLSKMSNTAFDLIRIIEREMSGIRDGDGGWHGSDVMGGVTSDLADLIEEYLRVTSPPAAAPTSDDEFPF